MFYSMIYILSAHLSLILFIFMVWTAAYLKPSIFILDAFVLHMKFLFRSISISHIILFVVWTTPRLSEFAGWADHVSSKRKGQRKVILGEYIRVIKTSSGTLFFYIKLEDFRCIQTGISDIFDFAVLHLYIFRFNFMIFNIKVLFLPRHPVPFLYFHQKNSMFSNISNRIRYMVCIKNIIICPSIPLRKIRYLYIKLYLPL